MKIRLELNWFQVLFWKCGPWKGHHGILNAHGMGSELDYKMKGKELCGSKLWFRL